MFPQLEILELIGRGGMGAIYKARQPALDRFVALKILPPQRSLGPNFAERFNREARALARLSHPNIVAVHEFGRVDNLHFFLMEYVDGVNLRQLEQAGRLSPRQALEIVPQICDALQYAHDEGVVHRDIKPENVLVDRKGRVKIADFGLARILNDPPATLRLTGEGQVMGTPHYMAPEQVERPLEVDHRADIYALGVVFYEMLTGELPLGKFAPPSRKVEVDVRLDDVVLRALEKEPALRYQHASDVKTGVEQIANTASADKAPSAPRLLARGVEIRPPRILGNARTWKRPAVAVLIAVGLVALAVLWFAWPSGDAPPNFVVIGTVTDAETGLPIAKARVADNRYHTGPGQAAQETWTDAEGRFRLPTWYEEHTISASAPGYATKLQTLLTKPFRRETEAYMDFQLAPSRASAAEPWAEAAASEVVSKAVPTLAEPPKRRLQMRLVAPDNDTTSPADEFPHPGDPSGQAKIRVLPVTVHKAWEACTPADVLNSWPLMTRAPMTQQLLDTTAPCLFRTREDGWGVLQVMGRNEDPPGVKIRYKLVTKPDPGMTPTTLPSVKGSPPP